MLPEEKQLIDLIESGNVDIKTAFSELVNVGWWKYGFDEFDSILMPDENVESLFRYEFMIPDDEDILYVRDTSFWSSKNQGLVITDKGFHCLPDNDYPENKFAFSWAFLTEVKYQNHTLYFYEGESKPSYSIGMNFFIKNADAYEQSIGSFLAEFFTKIAGYAANPIDVIYDEYNALLETKGEDEAVEYAINKVKSDSYAIFLYPTIVENLIHKENWEDAIFYCNEGLKVSDEDSYLGVKLRYLHGDICYYMEHYDISRCDYFKAFMNVDSEWTWGEENAEELIKHNFSLADDFFTLEILNLPYKDRKLIMPVTNFYKLDTINSFIMLDVDKCNDIDINFPTGHPIANYLYVGHPYIPNKYIPFETYQLELVEDKVREFCYLAQCLGATEISIECLNSTNSDKFQQSKGNIDASGGNVIFSGEFESNQKTNNRLIHELSKSISLHQSFEPEKSPYLPDGMVWYANEPSWQRLYSQRINGGLISHEERIETKKSQMIDARELSKLKAEITTFYADAKIQFTNDEKEKFTEQENALLAIKVKFARLKDLEENTQIDTISTANIILSGGEVEYYNELKACLDDFGTISERERRLLDKIRKLNGISSERANEIEESLRQKELSPEEQEYLNEYKEIIADGDISDRERRFLNKLKIMNGISDERAHELENLA